MIALVLLLLTTHADVTLSNGMRVIAVQDKLAPVVTTVMTYGVGSNDDTVPGVAHATEHMLFRGFGDLTSGQFSDIAARMGGTYNAQTSNEYTRYYFTAPSQYLPLILRLEAMRMTQAWIAPAEWANERGAVEQELRAQQSVPTYSLGVTLRSDIFGDTPLAAATGGTVESIQTLSAAQIRSFYRRWYHPNNATLVVAGDVEPRSVIQQARAVFAANVSAQLPAHRPVSIRPLAAATIDQRADVAFPSVAFGYRFPSLNSPDYAAALVLQAALNDPRGALADLSASGRTQGAGVLEGAFPEVGFAFVQAGVTAHGDVDATRALLDDTIATYLRLGVSSQLVADAKRRLSASRAFEQASIQSLAFGWADAAMLGRRTPLSLYAEIGAVTDADVNRVLHEYVVPSSRITVVIRPKPGAATPRTAALAPLAVENVAGTVAPPQPAPLWAQAFFKHALHAPSPLQYVQRYVLPNGIQLAVLSQRTAPVVYLAGTIKMNQTLHAPATKQGVLELTSALQSWGGGPYDRKGFESAAAAIPAAVRPGSSFGLRVEAKNFDRALALLADAQLAPAFPATGLQVLRSSFGQSLADEQSQPDWTARLAMEAALYPPSDPVRRHPSAATVRGLTIADVKQWYASAYRPDLTSIAVVGDIAPQYVRQEVQKYFGSWRAHGTKPDFHYPKVAMNGPASQDVSSADAHQTTVQFTELLPIYQSNSGSLALDLADTILTGEGESSLLFEDLRKNTGYVYNVDSLLDIGKVRSTYQFTFAADPKNAQAAAARLLADLRRLQTTAVSEDELTRAKETVLARSVLPLAGYAGIVDDLLAAESGTRNVSTGGYSGKSMWGTLLSLTPAQLRDAMARWIRVGDFVRITISPQKARAQR